MKRINKILTVGILIMLLALNGCSNSPKTTENQPKDSTQSQTQPNGSLSTQSSNETKPSATETKIDYSKIKPNESGKIMVVMFHNFITTYKSGDKEYTTTFDEFRKLLPVLYDKGYRLINVNDYLNNNISVPAGCMPMMFTFDDGTAGQFNLVEQNGTLVVNKDSAVGILEDFNKIHPDFGLKGTFYVNLGLSVFAGSGTVAQRLQYLIDKGFEIGNHTMTHVFLGKFKTADEIEKEVGGNQKKMYELIPNYKFTSLALPFGQAAKNLQNYVAKGEYQGTQYENLAIMEVGANPTVSPTSKNFNPLSTARVRATGLKAVDCDLAYWLKNSNTFSQYVSDGNPNTISVPKSKESEVDKSKLKGKQLIVY